MDFQSPHDGEDRAFLLLFRESRDNGYAVLSAEERQRLLQQWNAWYDSLAESGRVEHGNPLDANGRVVSGARGERVTDGPFAESTEAIGGYFYLTVRDLDEATAIAQQCPSLRYGMQVEVRPVAAECVALGVKGRPRRAAQL
jgi:hypothetical protein